jgi:hypothetical protein
MYPFKPLLVGLTVLSFSSFATRAHAHFVGEPCGSGPFASKLVQKQMPAPTGPYRE